MKKLELAQMENLQGGWGKSDWCVVGGALGAVGGALVGGPIGAVAVMSAAAWLLSC